MDVSLTQPGVLVHYLGQVFWPTGLNLDYGWPAVHSLGQAALPGLLIVGLLGLTVWALVKRPALGFLGAWFFVILAPTLSFVPIRDAAFDHRMYLPLAAIVVGVVLAAYALCSRLLSPASASDAEQPAPGGTPTGDLSAAVLVVALLIVVIGLGWATVQRNELFGSEVAIWQDAVDKNPDHARSHHNLGGSLDRAGKSDEAIPEYEQALKLDPNYAQPHNNLGIDLFKRGETDQAIEHYKRAIECNPKYADPYTNLANALVSEGKLAEAIDEYLLALKVDPRQVGARSNLATTLAKQGKIDEAVEQFRLALQIDPDNAAAHVTAHNGLGQLLVKQGDINGGIAHFETVLKLDPGNAVARNGLREAFALTGGKGGQTAGQYEKLLQVDPENAGAATPNWPAPMAEGKLSEAEAHYRSALAIQPDFADAHVGVGNLLVLQANGLSDVVVRQAKLSEAMDHFQQAIKLKPDDAESHCALGVALRLENNPGGAVEQWREAVRLQPKNPQYLRRLAWALATTPIRRFATAQRRSSLRRWPSNSPAAETQRRSAPWRRPMRKPDSIPWPSMLPGRRWIWP